jgi:thiamine kinase-like enzyme
VETAALVELIHTMPGWSDAAVTAEVLGGGITNRNWLVTVDGAQFVARVPGEKTEVLGIDRAHESEAAYRAATLGIGPAVRGPLPGVGTLVTAFVGGEHASTLEAEGLRLESAVAALRRFHRSGPIAGAFPIFRVVEWHARDAAAHGVSLPEVLGVLRPLAARIEAAFDAAPTPMVPCHNDLLPGNLLFADDGVWVIDFEYAGMNDHTFDLGNLSANTGLSAAGEERLLAAYYDGSVTDARRARLALMKIMSEYREGMWSVVQQGISTLDTIDFVAYAEERLGNCVRLCEAPEFTDWLAAAASGN